jgi:hypothetical protein
VLPTPNLTLNKTYGQVKSKIKPKSANSGLVLRPVLVEVLNTYPRRKINMQLEKIPHLEDTLYL